MKRLMIATVAILLLAGAVWAARSVEQPAARSLAAQLPPGALLYLEATDFSSLLKDWNASQEWKNWLASDNHEAFSRSRLFARLSQAQAEFSAAAGIPAGGDLLQHTAGHQSCLGLYDIGKLEFVYLTRLDQREVEATDLWQTRGKFEQRSQAGVSFFVHRDPESNRTAAFAAKDGWLILATREDLVASVLDRLQGQVQQGSLEGEEWFTQGLRQSARPAGDLRMVLHLEAIVPSPYFKSYWVQRNVAEMKQYTVAVSDLYRTSAQLRDERTLLRRTDLAAAPAKGVGALARLAPESAIFSSAQAEPAKERVLAALRETLLESTSAGVDAVRTAPSEIVPESAGGGGEFETEIDRQPRGEQAVDPYLSLKSLLDAARPTAQLEVYAARTAPDGVFTSMASALILEADRPWNDANTRDAITRALAPALTVGGLGAGWRPISTQSGDYHVLEGALPIVVAFRGNRFILGNDESLVHSVLARIGDTTAPDDSSYVAVFRHASAQPGFRSFMSRLDRIGHRGVADGERPGSDGEAPAFFSGNVASLSRVLSSVDEERVVEKDQGQKVTQTVTYTWSK